MNKIETLIKELCPDGVEWKLLEEVCDFKRGQSLTSKKAIFGDIPVIAGGQKPAFMHNVSNRENETIVVAGSGANAGFVSYWNQPIFVSDAFSVDIKNSEELNTKYVFHYLLSNQQKIYATKSGAGIPHVYGRNISQFKIPVPPFEVQEEIVKILDKFTDYVTELTTELTLRQKQYHYYRDKLLAFDNEEVEWKTLGDIGKVSMCKRILKKDTSQDGEIPFYKIGTFGSEPNSFISRSLFEEYKSKFSYPKKGDILISASGTIGRTVIFDGVDSYYQDSNIVWLEHDEKIILNKYLYYFYRTNPWKISIGGTIPRLYNEDIKKTKIPVPPLTAQNKIINYLDNLEKIVNDVNYSLPKEIELRQKQYEFYRDKLLSFD